MAHCLVQTQTGSLASVTRDGFSYCEADLVAHGSKNHNQIPVKVLLPTPQLKIFPTFLRQLLLIGAVNPE